MWQIKQFKTREKMNAWLERLHGRIQYEEIVVNNAYAVEWRWLRQL